MKKLLFICFVPLFLKADIVAQYHFDEFEGATSFLDSSFNGNNGSCSGGTCPAAGEMGAFNSAARFDGADDIITVPDNDNLDSTSTLSIQTWFYPTLVNGSADAILSKRVGANNNQSYSVFLYTGGRINVDIVSANDRFTTNTIFVADRWYHVSVTYDGSQSAANRVRVYVNGIEESNSPYSESSTSIPNYPSNLYFGQLNASYGNVYNGLIDEVTIYDTTLTAREVRAHYRMGLRRLVEGPKPLSFLTGHLEAYLALF